MPPLTDARTTAIRLFQHLSNLPFEALDAQRRTDPAALSGLGAGDAYFKATLFVHLLRLAGLPARMRWVEMASRPLTWGLWDFAGHSGMPLFYPLTEVWLTERWLTTDAYILDPPLCRALRAELTQRQRRSGYLMHVSGACDWDASRDAIQRFGVDDPSSWPLRDLGCFHSHADFLAGTRLHLPQTEVTRMAYTNQVRAMNEALAAMRQRG